MKRKKDKRGINTLIHNALLQYVKPILENLSNKHRLNLRIRILNRKIAQRPKYYMKYFVWIYAVVFVWCMVASIYSGRNEQKENLIPSKTIAEVSKTTEGFNMIHQLKNAEKKETKKIAISVVQLKNDIDSLMKLKERTHEDSISIIRKFRQIEILTQNIR